MQEINGLKTSSIPPRLATEFLRLVLSELYFENISIKKISINTPQIIKLI